MEKFIRKNTWIGLGAAVCVLLLGIALGAVLLNRGTLGCQSQSTYLVVLCGAAALLGCFIAARGKRQHLLRALVTAALLYLLLWILTLMADGIAVFDGYALRIGASCFLGGVAASLLVPRKEGKHPTRKGRKPVNKRGKHTVT